MSAEAEAASAAAARRRRAAATAAAVDALPRNNRLARALGSLDDDQLLTGRKEFVGTGAMAAIMQHEIQREEQRRAAVRAGRGALLPTSAGAATLATAPSVRLPAARARRARRRAPSDTTTTSSSGDESRRGGEGEGEGDEEEDEEVDREDEDQSLGAWLSTGAGSLWLADQLGECLETASAGLGSVDDALRLKFRRLRRKAAVAFATASAGAGPFAPPVPLASSPPGAAAAEKKEGGDTGLMARLKKRVRAKLLPAPVVGALNAVGVSADEYFATGQPLPLPFLVEKFIQRRAKVWVRRNLKTVFVIGGAAACASTLLVASVKEVVLGMAAVAPAVPLPRPRNLWGFLVRRVLRRGGNSNNNADDQKPLFYRYEAGDALGAVVDAAVAPGFIGPWFAIYVALRLIVGPDDRVNEGQGAVAAPVLSKKERRRKEREERRARRRREREEAGAGGEAKEAAATERQQQGPPERGDQRPLDDGSSSGGYDFL
jgi:hypothetical protein